jgi:hypothetical protein
MPGKANMRRRRAADKRERMPASTAQPQNETLQAENAALKARIEEMAAQARDDTIGLRFAKRRTTKPKTEKAPPTESEAIQRLKAANQKLRQEISGRKAWGLYADQRGLMTYDTYITLAKVLHTIAGCRPESSWMKPARRSRRGPRSPQTAANAGPASGKLLPVLRGALNRGTTSPWCPRLASFPGHLAVVTGQNRCRHSTCATQHEPLYHSHDPGSEHCYAR